jgi:Ca-activated chloride channel family protein
VEIPGSEGFPDLTSGEVTEGTALSLPPSGLPSLLAQGPGVLTGGQGEAPSGPDPSQPLVQLDLPTSMPMLAPESEPLRAPVQRAMDAAKEEREYAFMDGLLDLELRTWRNPGEPEGYFELRITPKKGESIPVLPKDVSFVVDASSSIPQHKLNITVKGLRAALKQLKPEDRFNVVVFRDAPQYFHPGAVPATKENLQAAGKFLDDLASVGQTDVFKALQPMVQQQPREGMPGVVVVVSDGRPTAGLQDSRAIINGLTSDNSNGNGVYAFGGGKTVNRYLLDLLAYRNKGAAQVASNIEDIEKGLPQFFLTLRDPILVDLSADIGRVDMGKVFPQSMPDFFQGQAVALYGRYNPEVDETFALRLAGKAGAEKKEVIFSTGFDEAEEGTRDIARGWAFQKAYHIIGRISREGESPELLNELKQLRAEYGVRTSYDE